MRKKITLSLIMLTCLFPFGQSFAQNKGLDSEVLELPVLEDFESGFTYFDNAPGNTVDFQLISNLYHSGSQSVNNAYTNNNNNILVETESIDLSNVYAPLLEFWHIAKLENGWDEAYVEISVNGGSSYNALPASAYLGEAAGYADDGIFDEGDYPEWSGETPDNTWWKHEIFDLSDYASANVKIRFRLSSDGSITRPGWYIDDIYIHEMTCPGTANQGEDFIGGTSVTLSWDEMGSATEWEIEYGAGNFNQGNGTSIIADSNPYTLENLSTETDYSWYIRSICSPGDSSFWDGPFQFTTVCDVLTPDYWQNFNTYLPDCWKEAEGPENGTLTFGNFEWRQDGFANNGNSGSARFNFYEAGDQDWLISPAFDLSGGSYNLICKVAITEFLGTSLSDMGVDDEMKLLVSEDQGLSWSEIYTWTNDNKPSNTGDTLTFDLSAYSSAATIFAMWANEGTNPDTDLNYNFYFDDFQIVNPGGCPAPSGLDVTDITQNSATIDWVENGEAENWTIQLGPQGFELGTGTNIAVDSKPYTLENLNMETTYDWYVRSECSGGFYSDWTGPHTFTTLPDGTGDISVSKIHVFGSANTINVQTVAPVEVSIYNLLGEMIYHANLNQTTKIPAQAGIFLVRIKDDKSSKTLRVSVY